MEDYCLLYHFLLITELQDEETYTKSKWSVNFIFRRITKLPCAFKFCLKLGKIAKSLNWPVERRWTELKHSYALQSSLVDATVHQEFLPQIFCDVYRTLSVILMFLCWTENVCYFICGAMYGWVLCGCLLLPTFCSSQTVCSDSFLFPKLRLYPARRTKNHRTAGLTTWSGCKETTSKVVALHSYLMCCILRKTMVWKLFDHILYSIFPLTYFFKHSGMEPDIFMLKIKIF